MGRVKSLYFNNIHGMIKREKILKINYDKMGYPIVGLSKNGKLRTRTIHRLVAETFIDNPNNYAIINHKDCNKTNNNIENLEWCTQKHNVMESFRNGLQKAPKGKESTSSKKVLQYDLQGNFIRKWDCTMDIQRELGIANQHISACCLGKYKSSNGYIWRYAEESELMKED